jgi:hypothetical protein
MDWGFLIGARGRLRVLLGVLVVLAAVCGAGASEASAADSVYWTVGRGAVDAIRFGPLAGGGAGPAQTLFGAFEPTGVAIDPAAGKIYWGELGGQGIWAGNLNWPSG